jgi:DNA polymerase-1
MDNSKLEYIPKNSCVFDIESDGLLDSISKIHSLVIYDLEQEQLYSYANQPGYESIQSGIEKLLSYDVVIGHNIISFDVPALGITHDIEIRAKVLDTYNMSTLIYTDLINRDYTYHRFTVPDDLKGRHSLEAWGYRLELNKGEFGKTTDWKNWSPEMQEYCELDVKVNVKLFKAMLREEYSMRSINLEMDFQKFIHIQERQGVNFDEAAGRKLARKLKVELGKVDMEIVKVCPPWTKQLKTKVKEIPFNPGSRDHIARFLIEKYSWQPEIFSEKTKKPKMTEEVLTGLTFPEVKLFLRRFAITNLQAKLATGDKSWLKFVRDGKIHGRVITNGAVSGRCTHSSPNLAQCTSPRKPFGKEARSIFIAPPGFNMVGADAKGLELRCQAHYLYPYDGGRFAELVVSGDPHTANQEAADLPNRDDAKRFIYAFNYGGGDELIGGLIDSTLTTNQKKQLGRDVKRRFLSRTPGMPQLLSDVKSAAKYRGWLRGLDGRRLHVRSQHMALNILLQGAGAVIMKQSAINFWETRNKYMPNYKDVFPVLNIHDEIQCISPEIYAESVGIMLCESMTKAGKDFNFNCLIEGDYKIGSNWMETH